jgi:hypothetical protein
MVYMALATLSIDGKQPAWESALPMATSKPMKRPEGSVTLQVNVSRELHARYKAACSLLGVRMTEDLIRHMELVVSKTLPAPADRPKPSKK